MGVETKKRLVEYLYALANGAEPYDRWSGICCSVVRRFSMDEMFPLLGVWATVNPLPYTPGDKWTGELGAERRTLCGITAAFIEAEMM